MPSPSAPPPAALHDDGAHSDDDDDDLPSIASTDDLAALASEHDDGAWLHMVLLHGPGPHAFGAQSCVTDFDGDPDDHSLLDTDFDPDLTDDDVSAATTTTTDDTAESDRSGGDPDPEVDLAYALAHALATPPEVADDGADADRDDSDAEDETRRTNRR